MAFLDIRFSRLRQVRGNNDVSRRGQIPSTAYMQPWQLCRLGCGKLRSNQASQEELSLLSGEFLQGGVRSGLRQTLPGLRPGTRCATCSPCARTTDFGILYLGRAHHLPSPEPRRSRMGSLLTVLGRGCCRRTPRRSADVGATGCPLNGLRARDDCVDVVSGASRKLGANRMDFIDDGVVQPIIQWSCLHELPGCADCDRIVTGVSTHLLDQQHSRWVRDMAEVPCCQEIHAVHHGHRDMCSVLNRLAWHRTRAQKGPAERPGLVDHI